MSASSPILIAGAGPTGLYLGLLLARAGIPVRIIDKDLRPQPGSRGTGIQPRTVEIMHMLGVLPEIIRQGRQQWHVTSYKMPGGTEISKEWDIAEIVPNTPNNPFMLPRSIAQNTHTHIIVDELEKYSVHIEKGKAINGFTQDADGVTCEVVVQAEDGSESHETIHTPFLCGADGARGAVRRLLGCTFLGESKTGDVILVCDIEVKGLSHDTWHVWSNKTENSTGLQFMARHLRDDSDLVNVAAVGFGFDISTVDIEAPGAFQKLFRDHVGREDLQFGEPVWFSHFRPSMRMVDKLGEGRVFVLGDAAHTHSPTGGQGMNSSIQDALNLSWKLALVYNNSAPLSLLTTFTDERLPVIAQMLDKTTELYKRTGDPKDDPSKGAFFRPQALFMLGVNYRWSNLVLDTRTPQPRDETHLDILRANAYGGQFEDGATVLVAGDRAPDAPSLSSSPGNGSTALFSLFDLKRHTVLFFVPSGMESDAGVKAVDAALTTLHGGVPLPASKVVQTVVLSRKPLPEAGVSFAADRVLSDSEGHAFGGYGVSDSDDGLTIVVVRPDTYVGAIVRTREDMMQYFSRIFSSI